MTTVAPSARARSTNPATRSAWRAETIWIEREQARTAGTPLDPAKEAELQAIIESVKARDPGNNRLGRWDPARR